MTPIKVDAYARGEVVGIGLDWYLKQRYNAGFKTGFEEGRRLGREAVLRESEEWLRSQGNDKARRNKQ